MAAVWLQQKCPGLPAGRPGVNVSAGNVGFLLVCQRVLPNIFVCLVFVNVFCWTMLVSLLFFNVYWGTCWHSFCFSTFCYGTIDVPHAFPYFWVPMAAHRRVITNVLHTRVKQIFWAPPSDTKSQLSDFVLSTRSRPTKLTERTLTQHQT